MQREFSVTCSHDEGGSVVAAAAYLDKQIREVAKGSQLVGLDRCAVIAGLNISHELLELRKLTNTDTNVNSRLENLHQQIDDVVVHMQSKK